MGLDPQCMIVLGEIALSVFSTSLAFTDVFC
jgi:hypothetical protein